MKKNIFNFLSRLLGSLIGFIFNFLAKDKQKIRKADTTASNSCIKRIKKERKQKMIATKFCTIQELKENFLEEEEIKVQEAGELNTLTIAKSDIEKAITTLPVGTIFIKPTNEGVTLMVKNEEVKSNANSK